MSESKHEYRIETAVDIEDAPPDVLARIHAGHAHPGEFVDSGGTPVWYALAQHIPTLRAALVVYHALRTSSLAFPRLWVVHQDESDCPDCEGIRCWERDADAAGHEHGLCPRDADGALR